MFSCANVVLRKLESGYLMTLSNACGCDYEMRGKCSYDICLTLVADLPVLHQSVFQ